jgi:hypothetical protein
LLANSFVEMVDGLPEIQDEALTSLQAEIVQAVVDRAGDRLRILRGVERIDLGITQTNT